MLTQEENDLLTRTGPGTPGGELLRRYWQPVALAEELPPGGAPLPVRILGEDLVLFRDDQGRPGLLGIHCSHRGADLSYGRLEDGGLRCIYHGWLYDVHGRCLEQPGEPAVGTRHASPLHERIRHPAYPCREDGGLILTYMGPGEPPLLTPYEFLEAPVGRRFATKDFRDCSYLQGNEGNIDPQHLGLLHWTAASPPTSAPYYHAHGPKPIIEVEETDFGVRLFTMVPFDPAKNYVKITNFILPNLGAFEGSSFERLDGYGVNWHVPIDDTHHWVYTLFFDRQRSLDREAAERVRPQTTPSYQRTRTRANRYLQDREAMKVDSFAGLATAFGEQDACVIEARPVQDRTREQLGANDRAIIASRVLLLKALRAIQDGRDPPHVFRRPPANGESNIVVMHEEIPISADWRAYLRSKTLLPAAVAARG
jgi:phenylpropionate dioxygenase-like ring-hydroxylating dioxygenase large terminal subunit